MTTEADSEYSLEAYECLKDKIIQMRQDGFFTPSYKSYIPALFKKTNLQEANSLIQQIEDSIDCIKNPPCESQSESQEDMRMFY